MSIWHCTHAISSAFTGPRYASPVLLAGRQSHPLGKYSYALRSKIITDAPTQMTEEGEGYRPSAEELKHIRFEFIYVALTFSFIDLHTTFLLATGCASKSTRLAHMVVFARALR